MRAILSHRRVGKKGLLEYLVGWKGYTKEHDSWEPEANLLEGAAEAVDVYTAKSKPTSSSLKKKKKKLPTSELEESADETDIDKELAQMLHKKKRKAVVSKVKEEPSKKKRGRPSKLVKEPTPEINTEDDISVADVVDQDGDQDELEEESRVFSNKDKTEYKDLKSWETLIHSVNSIHRQPDRALSFEVYWLEDDTFSEVKESIAREKFPNHVRSFQFLAFAR